MAEILTNNKNYYDIAATIRQMKNVNTTYKPREMASALKDIYSNEVEGTLPLSFEANGNDLLNYKIDGASGGVGDKTKNLCTNKNNVVGIYVNGSITGSNQFRTSDFIPVEYGKTYTASIFDLDGNRINNMVYEKINTNKEWIGQNSSDKSITINDENIAYLRIRNFASNSQYITNNNYKYQLEEGSTATDYEPYGYKVPVVVSGKNLFDGIYGANHFSKIEPDKTITISTKSTGESSITFVYKKSDGTRFRYTRLLNENETSGSVTVTTPSEAVGIGIYAATDYTSQTMIYDTLIEYRDRATTYEPYHEPITTNIYLDEPIEENESISLSDTNVDIPTIEGTNVITIDTTVQPSNVYIQAPKDSDEIIEIINTLEAI